MSKIEPVAGSGLALIDGKLWSRCKVRKTATCKISGSKINKGDEAYRPTGNGDNRMYRIKASIVDRHLERLATRTTGDDNG